MEVATVMMIKMNYAVLNLHTKANGNASNAAV
jgi:hypothetical protein